MNPISQTELEKLDISYLEHFDKARLSTHPLTRLNNVRVAALKLREDILAGNTVSYYQTFDFIQLNMSYMNTCSVLTLFIMHILDRLFFVIQFKTLFDALLRKILSTKNSLVELE
ncbi:hypothetical protein F2A31_05920 [Acinetobacter suaedae]|uniref:Uncharacterized protein n=1 Tax=Acinetobacter suaedae TaxID=2609668 RepID=A0A5P1UT17_9GAMM|nr:hypothetical protein [Acinetobacter sp. C16S1]QER39263.1 hypothetical protein F2A31_05920 [Acinetobacter sp. C16S1]